MHTHQEVKMQLLGFKFTGNLETSQSSGSLFSAGSEATCCSPLLWGLQPPLSVADLPSPASIYSHVSFLFCFSHSSEMPASLLATRRCPLHNLMTRLSVLNISPC